MQQIQSTYRHCRWKPFITRGIFFLSLICFVFVTNHASAQVKTETGTASYYHDKFIGRLTSSGVKFDQTKFTAAHKTLPLGTWVKVTNLNNDSTVVVQINDRMPAWNKRSIDLSKAGAKQLNYIYAGLTKVKIEIIPDPSKKKAEPVIVREIPATDRIPETTLSLLTIPYEGVIKYTAMRVEFAEKRK